ncbi:coiled-coil domain-containing protein 7 [Alligator mississippiensis]|uniref:coiled-coil domain-containing protein 7 n=1 Tax=Alligator mississippiensis TaxID=8496 RepID=UPI0028780F16|nr:coiled-coil domain-containing protein 7 [Alligator mississippiensis]
MNARKQMKPSTPSEADTGTSFLKKGPLNLQGSPTDNLKIKGRIKLSGKECEPMVLLPAAPVESFMKYSLQIPSVNKDDSLDEVQMLRNVTKRLNGIIHAMEYVYQKKPEVEEREEADEEGEDSVEGHEDMTTSLLGFSSIAKQLETTLQEQKEILESLTKWFGKEVQQMEELGKDELFPELQLPVADKDITDSIIKLTQHIRSLEELRNRIHHLPKSVQPPLAKQEKKRKSNPVAIAQRDPKAILEELARKHGTEDVISMTHVFEDDLAPQTIEVMNTRMLEIIKVFERQTNKLQRILNEQDVLEGKYQKIENEYQILAEEKQIMENELQKMKETEKMEKEKIMPELRKKFSAFLQPSESETLEAAMAKIQTGGKPKKVSSQAKKESENQKMKEDLLKAQECLQVLEREKKSLEEKLQKALKETENASKQLSKPAAPASIQDAHFSYAKADSGNEDANSDVKINSKDLSRKGKKPTKSKGKGEYNAGSGRKSINEADKPEQKLSAFHNGKQVGNELFRKRSSTDTKKIQETLLSSQLKDVKLEKEDSDREICRDYGIPANGLREQILVQEKEPLYKAYESLPVTEETQVNRLGEQDYENAQYTTRPADQDSVSLLPIQVTERSSEKEMKAHGKGKSEAPLKVDPQRSTKPRKATETKKGSLVRNRASKETHNTAVSEGQEKALHKDSTKTQEQLLPRSLDRREKLPPLISERQKKTSPLVSHAKENQVAAAVRSGVQKKDPSLFISEKHTLASTLTAKPQDAASVKDSLTYHEVSSDDLGTVTEEFQQISDSSIGKIPASESQKKIYTAFIPEHNKIPIPVLSVSDEMVLREDGQESLKVYQDVQFDVQDSSDGYETVILEKAPSTARHFPSSYRKASHLQENEIKKLSDKTGLPLEDHLADVKDVHKTENLAAFLLEPVRTMGKEVDELSEQRRLLLPNLESNLQQTQCIAEKEENEPSEQIRLLLATLESDLKDLQQTQDFADGQSGSESGSKEDELTDQRILAANLEANVQDLPQAHTPATGLLEKYGLNERELSELAEKRRLLLASFESTLKDLQEAQALAACQLSGVNEEELSELAEKRNLEHLQELQALAACQPCSVNENEMHNLSEKRRLFLANLESGWKDLQQAHALLAAQPGNVIERKVSQEFSKNREHLLAKVEENLKGLQQAQVLVSGQLGKFGSSGLQLEPTPSIFLIHQDRSRASAKRSYSKEMIPYITHRSADVTSVSSRIHGPLDATPVLSTRFNVSSRPSIPSAHAGMETQSSVWKRRIINKKSFISQSKGLKGLLGSLPTPQKTEIEPLCISGKSYTLLSSRSSETKRS